MWISSLSIKDFRCFESLELSFREGLNIVVGENNVGKSTMFAAISKLFASTAHDPVQINPLDLRYGKLREGFGPSIECTVSLNEEEREKLVDNLFHPSLTLAEKAKAYQLLASVVKNLKIVFQQQEGTAHTYIQLGPMFVTPHWISSEVRWGGPTHSFNDIPRRLESARDKLTFEEVLAQEPRWESRDVLQRVGGFLSAHLRVFAEFRTRPAPHSRSAILESLQGGDTAIALFNLKTHHQPHERERYKTVCSEFSDFFPTLTIEAVESAPGSGVADIQVIEANHQYPIPLENIGAGVAELVILLTNLVARKGIIFVIEEPESHLHPQAKRRLQELIKNSAERNQLFVITHDPYFAHPENLDALTRLWLTNQGTLAASLPNTLSQKAHAQLKTAMKDPTKREVLFARTAIFVEDESQRNFLHGCANALNYRLDSSGISVISVDGADGFKPYVELAKALRIPYLCLRDLHWGSGTKRPPELFRSLGYELENFLEQAGLGKLIEQAKRRVGTSKPRVAQYIGEHIKTRQVPALFHELIVDTIELSKE